MFSTRISNRSLAILFRNLATLLSSGVPMLKALRTSGRNVADRRVRNAMTDIESAVRKGEDLTEAMDRTGAFPAMTVEMIRVAEQTGQLPEILKHLAAHYENLVAMRKMFTSAIAWPVFQLVAAIFVIALLILLLGMIASSQGGEPFDPLGLGLSGPSGALIWLGGCFGTLGGLVLSYLLLKQSIVGQRVIDPLLLRIPVIGGCLQSFALARFSWALALTQQTGMHLDQCLDVSLRATSNGAYLAEIPRTIAMIRAGEELPDTLAATGLFPNTYLQMIDVADTSGTVPEMLERISPELEADARRSLSALVAVAGWTIWAMVAVFIIVLIFRVFSMYIGMINDASRGL